MTTILEGDCLQLLRKLPSRSVDMVITSPPYADQRKNSYGGVPEAKYIEWFTPIAQEVKRVLKPEGSFFINIKPHSKKGQRSLYVFKLIIALTEEIGFRFVDEFAWTKLGVPGKFKGKFKNAFEPVYHFSITDNFIFNPYAVALPAKEVSVQRYRRKSCGDTKNGSGFGGMRKEIFSNVALPSNHLHIPQKSNQHTAQSKHPAVFPVELSDFFIKAFSNEGGVILDIFAGSGTVGVSSEKLGRRCILMEQKPEYVSIIKQRTIYHYNDTWAEDLNF
jgi:site-specific DNA-methyltransferase (adenine-specific)